MRIVLTGGGTGGHIIPFEPIVEAVRILHVEKKSTLPERLEPAELTLNFLGVADESTKSFFASYDIPVTHIPAGKLRRYMSHLTIIDILFRVPAGIIKALYHMWKIMPDVVISKGGYGSLPVVLVAFFYHIPVLLHESDSVPGLANVVMARFASTIAVGFPETKQALPKKLQNKAVATGVPVRTRFSAPDQSSAKRSFGLMPEDLVLLVIGGSQGAQQLNEVLLKNLSFLITETAIIHVTGPQNFKAISTLSQELLTTSSRRDKYKAFPYLEDTIDEAYNAADIVISRAGATTLAELAHLHKTCILIPLAGAAGDHQRRNAAIYEQAGAARVLEPTNLGVNLFRYNVEELIKDQKLRESLATNIAKLDHPNAAREVAQITFTLAQGQVPVYKADV